MRRQAGSLPKVQYIHKNPLHPARPPLPRPPRTGLGVCCGLGAATPSMAHPGAYRDGGGLEGIPVATLWEGVVAGGEER